MCGCIVLFALQATVGRASIASPSGVRVDVDGSTGNYEVTSSSLHWRFVGKLDSPTTDMHQSSGRDSAGAFREIHFNAGKDLACSIRCYDQSAAVKFQVRYLTERHGNGVTFPRFTGFPANLFHFSYLDDTFAPFTFGLAQTSTPWLLFDSSRKAAIFSPASNFMVAKMVGDGTTSIGEGLNNRLQAVPRGLEQDSLLVFAEGIDQVWDAWGQTLRAIYRRKTPAPDSDVLLKSFGYWTDNGADYYYNYDPSQGYAQTLFQLTSRYRSEGIPLGYLQLDSWWYEKSTDDPSGKPGGATKNSRLPFGEWNRYGGLMEYRADPALFPNGLAVFDRDIGLPLVVHNRWIDRNSPYHERYKISGIGAVDPNWWRDIVDYVASSGVVCYEQDWLDPIYEYSPEMASKVGVADAFSDGMANATANKGLTMQYCMATPRFFLQGVKYPNLTTIRTSGDRFEPRKWANFLWTSQLAAGAGIWPWCDVFKSSETGNMILSVLSGGPVGTGDAMGKEDKTNILMACRPDGVIVKPDRPILPDDRTYLDAANQRTTPFLASTNTEQSGLRTTYLFAFPRPKGEREYVFKPSEYGYAASVYAYDMRSKLGGVVPPQSEIVTKIGDEGYFYGVLAPVSKSGIALLGDLGKIVPTGRQRIDVVKDSKDSLTFMVRFAKGESPVAISFWSPTAPTVYVAGLKATATPGDSERYVIEVPSNGGSTTIVTIAH